MKDTLPESPVLNDGIALVEGAATAAQSYATAAADALTVKVSAGDRISGKALEADQYAAHGLAWIATYAETLTQTAVWAKALDSEGQFGEMEALLMQIGMGEYLAQLSGGLPMSQGEFVRAGDLGLMDAARALATDPAVQALTSRGNTDAARQRLGQLIIEQEGATAYGATGLDAEYEIIRDQFRRFAVERVLPDAHEWHLKDELIPMEIIEEMAELGVFGLTIPDEYGGFGMGKTAMCVVSEELSRGYLGVGSLGTRSEIAAELILCGGTEAQKQEWLPKLASAETLPTAVFTEPNTGSDLGALKTRGVQDADGWTLTGNKTWITHAARTDVMTVLARTIPGTDNYAGLSMFLAPKTRGDCANPFPRRDHPWRRDRGAGLSRHEGIHACARRSQSAERRASRRG